MTENVRRRLAATRQQLALLRALAKRDATSEWVGTDDAREIRVGSRSGGGMITAPRAFVSALASLGLLGDKGGAIGITSAGLAWLRRRMASNEPFQEQHRETRRRPVPGAPKGGPLVHINDAESPLAWLRRRKDRIGSPLLDDTQFEAGERLRRDYTFAAMLPRVTADWSAVSAPGGQRSGGTAAASMRDDVVAAKGRVRRAISAVGPELGRILVDVCCLLKGIETAESEQGLPQRSGKVVLQLALTALARHYGLLASPRKGRSGDQMLHWGQSDFRPTI